MSPARRRYDVDWLRVMAIGLLLIYHVAIGFQPWGGTIGFITNGESWETLWLPMSLLNVWRIPFLFVVSGMGVYFSMEQRTWKALLRERSRRILLPCVFGAICVFPASVLIRQHYYHRAFHYVPHPGHLWFLVNIFVYVVALSPLFFYLRGNRDGAVVSRLRIMLSNPLGLISVVGLFVAEALVMQPRIYELYVLTWHGLALGALAFLVGFCAALCGPSFWGMLRKWRWLFLLSAAGLFAIRSWALDSAAPGVMLAVESNCWIFSVLAFGSKHLNRPGEALSYLSQAAYPVYIVHLVFLFWGSALVFPLAVSAPLKFVAVLLFTVAGSFAAFELIRRVGVLRPLFGLTMKERPVRRREESHMLVRE